MDLNLNEIDFKKVNISNANFIIAGLNQDLHGTKNRIKKLISWLLGECQINKSSCEFSLETIYFILKFVKQKKHKSFTQGRILRYLNTFKCSFTLYEPIFSDFSDSDKAIDDIEALYVYYVEKSWKSSTKESNWGVLITLFKYLNEDLNLSEYKFKRAVEILDPSKLIKEEEIENLLSWCKNLQEKFMVSLLWDSGCRAEELLNLRFENIDIIIDKKTEKEVIMLTLIGKTGKRFIPLIWSLPIVKAFLFNKNKYGHIFHNDYANPFSKKNLEIFLKRITKYANLGKRVYPHLFRHSRATYLAKYQTDRQMCFFFGWSASSSMPSRYTHLAGNDLINKMLEVNMDEFKVII